MGRIRVKRVFQPAERQRDARDLVEECGTVHGARLPGQMPPQVRKFNRHEGLRDPDQASRDR
jgi:hypothetical protein